MDNENEVRFTMEGNNLKEIMSFFGVYVKETGQTLSKSAGSLIF